MKVFEGRLVSNRHYRRLKKREQKSFEIKITKIVPMLLPSLASPSPQSLSLPSSPIPLPLPQSSFLPSPLSSSSSSLSSLSPSLPSPPQSLEFITSNLNAVENRKLMLNRIRQWAMSGVSRQKINEILNIMASCDQDTLQSLPCDARTLLRPDTIPRMLEKIDNEGDFIYLGIEFALKRIPGLYDGVEKEIHIDINIDGLPLFKSSSLSLWPILGKISRRVFLIGAYCGHQKPKNLEKYLGKFIAEANELFQNGLVLGGEFYIIKISKLICDAPAKAFVMGILNYNAYSSRTKCTIKGQYIERRMSFLPGQDEVIEERSDEVWRQTSSSPMVQLLGFHFIQNLPIDYMHAILLGKTKMLISNLRKGPALYKISELQAGLISERLLKLKSYCPSDFQRKPREISQLADWKATELRQFLLYTSPVVLKGIVGDDAYTLWMNLHFACRLMCDVAGDFNSEYIREILTDFIDKFVAIFGNGLVTHNVHTLTHFPDEVLRYGNLDGFSSFPFENFLFRLKSTIKSPNRPLQQICSRYDAIHATPAPVRTNPKFEFEVKGYNFKIKQNNKADRYCGVGDDIYEIFEIISSEDGTTFFRGYKFQKIVSFYRNPKSSKLVNVYKIFNKSSTVAVKNIFEITAKYFLMPYKDDRYFVAVKILHH